MSKFGIDSKSMDSLVTESYVKEFAPTKEKVERWIDENIHFIEEAIIGVASKHERKIDINDIIESKTNEMVYEEKLALRYFIFNLLKEKGFTTSRGKNKKCFLYFNVSW